MANNEQLVIVFNISPQFTYFSNYIIICVIKKRSRKAPLLNML